MSANPQVHGIYPYAPTSACKGIVERLSVEARFPPPGEQVDILVYRKRNQKKREIAQEKTIYGKFKVDIDTMNSLFLLFSSLLSLCFILQKPKHEDLSVRSRSD